MKRTIQAEFNVNEMFFKDRKDRSSLNNLVNGAIATTASIALLSCTPSTTDRQQPPNSSVTQAYGSMQQTDTSKTTKSAAPSVPANTDTQSSKIQTLMVRQELGQTVLMLKLFRPISQYRHFTLAQPSRVVLEVLTDDKQMAEAETFRPGTNWVSTVRVSSGEGFLRFTMDVPRAGVPPYTITPDDDGVKIVIGNADPGDAIRRSVELVRAGKRTDGLFSDGSLAASSNIPGGSKVEPPASTEAKRYTGQRLSLDFKDADIKNVFRLLAEVSGLNIVVTNEVTNKVTLRLIDVPWDQALDLLIDTNGLGKEQRDNVVRVSTADQLKKERDAVAAAKKAEENLEPVQTAYFNVNYARARDLEPKIKAIQSKRAEASLVVDDRSNTIMVRDGRKTVEDIRTLVTKLDLRTPQVLIESNLIETTPTFARALGNRLTFELLGSTFSSAAGAGTPFVPNLTSFPNAPIGLGATLSVIQNKVGGFRNLANSLEAAENEGNIRIISRPSVVTLNNQSSTIRSERILRIALPASTNIASGSGSSAAGAAIATEKVPIGINLTVTPQVSSDGYVLMNINVKSSSIAANPTVSSGTSGVIPFDELNREANASVLVKDGDTIVLGGILKDTAQENESGIPYLKDIPILGWLFKNHRWQKDFEELMVFITPRLTSAGSENLPNAEQLWRDQMQRTMGDQTASTPPVNP